MQKAVVSGVFWTLIKTACGLFFCLFWIAVIKWPFNEGKPEIGKPYYDEKVHLCWGEITDYLIYGDNLVLLYDDKRVIQFYSLNGAPLFSYNFLFQNNGSSELYTDGNHLIVEDHRRNYYLFSAKGEFLEYITDKNRKEVFRDSFVSASEARTAGDGSIFILKGASIYKTTNNETQIIVDRPFFMAIFQRGRTLIFAVAFAILLAIRYSILKK